LKFRPFDKVERCFDNVAENDNIVEATGDKVACCFDNAASVDRALATSVFLCVTSSPRARLPLVAAFSLAWVFALF